MPILKQCSYHGCSKILEDGIKYCEYHERIMQEKERERFKEYQYKRRKDESMKNYIEFYSSKEWKQIRMIIIAAAFHIDILEFYRTGKIVKGETVHHIIETSEDWNSRLDINNLIYVTEKNHRRIHAEYNKGKKERKAMQTILFTLLDKFNKEYC